MFWNLCDRKIKKIPHCGRPPSKWQKICDGALTHKKEGYSVDRTYQNGKEA